MSFFKASLFWLGFLPPQIVLTQALKDEKILNSSDYNNERHSDLCYINLEIIIIMGISPYLYLTPIKPTSTHHKLFFLQQLIYSRFFCGKSDSDLCTLFSDRTLINRRNVTGDPHSSYRANRDFLHTIFQSQVITAAMTVLDLLANKVPQHTTPYQKTWRKWEKPRNLSSSMASLKR